MHTGDTAMMTGIWDIVLHKFAAWNQLDLDMGIGHKCISPCWIGIICTDLLSSSHYFKVLQGTLPTSKFSMLLHGRQCCGLSLGMPTGPEQIPAPTSCWVMPRGEHGTSWDIMGPWAASSGSQLGLGGWWILVASEPNMPMGKALQHIGCP